MRQLFAFILLLASCTTGGEKKADPTNEPTAQNDSFQPVNAVLFQNTQTAFFYYDADYECGWEATKSADSHVPQYRCILQDDGTCFEGVDLPTFRNYGTFCLDKNTFYYLEDHPGDRTISTVTKKVRAGTYFDGSYYWIQEGTLNYFGQTWKSDSLIQCPEKPIAIDLDHDHFFVLESRGDDPNCKINAYAVLNGRLMFHGCWMDPEKPAPDLSDWLNDLVEQKSYAEPVEVRE